MNRTIDDLIINISERDVLVEKEEELVAHKQDDIFVETGLRRNGKTTRVIDAAVQHLFKYNSLLISFKYGSATDFSDPDHSEHTGAQYHFANSLIRRINEEHSGQFNIDRGSGQCLIRRKSFK